MSLPVRGVAETCQLLHELASQREVFRFPFDAHRLPTNGVYLLFEVGEVAHGGPRIVRVGTHTGDGQLRSRLIQHFVKEVKDRSIFRKNIGRCILNAASDPYASVWEMDHTSRAARLQPHDAFDITRQMEIEKEVSEIIQNRFSFTILTVQQKADRLRIESGLISLLYACPECTPSERWLGRHSPKRLIRESGLWQVNQLEREPLRAADILQLLR